MPCKEKLIGCFIIGLLSLLFFSNVLDTGKILYNNPSDLLEYSNPRALSFIQSYTQFHEIPFWSPFINGGIPSFGNPEPFVFYPPNYLFLVFRSITTFNYLFILHVFLAGIFMFFFLQKRLDIVPSLFGSVAYMFSGQLIGHIYAGQYGHVVSFAYLPLIFLLAEKILEKRKIVDVALLALILSLDYLGAHPQFVIYTILGAFVFVVIRLFFAKMDKKTFLHMCTLYGLAGILFFGIISPQLFPILEYSAFMGKVSEYSATANSFFPVEIVKLFIPNIFGKSVHYLFLNIYTESLFYIGIIAITLFAFLFFKRKELNLDSKIFFALACIFVFLALGKFNPLYEILRNIPILSSFRSPVRAIFITSFALAVLSAYSFSFFLKSTKEEAHKFLRLIFFLIAGIALLTVVAVVFKPFLESIIHYLYSNVFQHTGFVQHYSFDVVIKQYFNPGIEDFVSSSLISLVLLTLFYFTIRIFQGKRTLLGYLICGLLVLDLFIFSSGSIDSKPLSYVYPEDPVVAFLSNVSFGDPVRSYVSDYNISTYQMQLALLEGMHGVGTFSLPNFSLKQRTELQQEFQTTNSTNLLNKFNIKYVVLSKPQYKNLTLLVDYGSVKIYENNNYFKRVFFLNATEKQPQIITYTPNSMLINVTSDRPEILFVTENYYPGWEANCDGKKVGIESFENFMVMNLTKDCSVLSLRYTPTNFLPFAAVSLISILLCFSIVLYQFFIYVHYRKKTP